MKTILIYFVFAFIALSALTKAQVVYEPINNTVYNFLERLSVEGIINLNSNVKPYSRMYIAGKLERAELNKDKLSTLEQENLKFYIKDYYDEIQTLNKKKVKKRTEFLTTGISGRFRLFDYKDSLFSIYVDPILGLSAERFHSSSYTHRWNGASLFGYISDFIGFSLSYKDNQENGDYLDRNRSFTPLDGINHTASYNSDSHNLQHDEVNASVTASWSWGTFTFGKDYINWGSSLMPNGQLILSSKAPSFPFIELRLHPVKWLRFSYIHGWLHSGIIDSSTIHYSPVPGRQNYLQIPKFIAAHLLSIDFSNNFTLSLGESMIYSERIEPIYLIPIMFFRAADHYMQKDSSNTGSNAQLFADASVKVPSIRSKFYSTLFIDEFSLTSILDHKNGASAVAYTLGAEIADPIIDNSVLVLEYTRINPFVYMNSNIAQTYSSYGYQLGNWIGSNGDIINFKYTQDLLRGLSVNVWGTYARKGSKEKPVQQYELPYPSFLFGLRKTYREAGASINFEIIHTFNLKLYFDFKNITDEDKTRTPGYLLGDNRTFGFSIGYGE